MKHSKPNIEKIVPSIIASLEIFKDDRCTSKEDERRVDEEIAAVHELADDAKRFRALQSMDHVKAQAFFWNYRSRKERAAAIDKAMAEAGNREKPLEYTRKCSACDGQGITKFADTIACEVCNGTGQETLWLRPGEVDNYPGATKV